VKCGKCIKPAMKPILQKVNRLNFHLSTCLDMSAFFVFVLPVRVCVCAQGYASVCVCECASVCACWVGSWATQHFRLPLVSEKLFSLWVFFVAGTSRHSRHPLPCFSPQCVCVSACRAITKISGYPDYPTAWYPVIQTTVERNNI